MTLIADSSDTGSSNTAIDLELFFRSSKDLFCIAGFDGYFKKVNPAVVETLGYTEDELLSKPINSFIYNEDQLITEQRREKLRSAELLLNFENRYVSKTGELIWLSWTSVPNIELQLVFAVAKNITPYKTRELEKVKALEDLNAHQQKLKELVYMAVHDLRSPVSNMQSIFEIFDELKAPSAPYEESLTLLKKSVADLKVRLDNYLDRLIGEEHLGLHIKPLKFSEALSRVQLSLSSLITETRTIISTDFSGAETVMFDETCLDSIFLNLVSNSIKYARPGVAPVIDICSKQHGKYIQVIVKDNGKGFEMNTAAKRIFQISQRFHKDAEGKGVGLYLVKSHLVSLGGDITVQSSPGRGTTFTLTFKNEL